MSESNAPCCEHSEVEHWPEGNCRICLDLSCDWYGERRGLPRPDCRCDFCQDARRKANR